MGQCEIFDYLMMLRKTGDHEFYTVTEIHKKVGNGSIRATSQNLTKLYMFGFLDISVVDWRNRKYRLKIDNAKQ